MKLSEQAIKAIDNLNGRLAIAKALNFTETWVRVVIDKNKSNGPLTTESALQAIERETGLTREQILETESAAA